MQSNTKQSIQEDYEIKKGNSNNQTKIKQPWSTNNHGQLITIIVVKALFSCLEVQITKNQNSSQSYKRWVHLGRNITCEYLLSQLVSGIPSEKQSVLVYLKGNVME